MIRHHREQVTQEKRYEVEKALQGLTDGEVVSILSQILSSCAKYMIREERHGDREKPGGIE